MSKLRKSEFEFGEFGKSENPQIHNFEFNRTLKSEREEKRIAKSSTNRSWKRRLER